MSLFSARSPQLPVPQVGPTEKDSAVQAAALEQRRQARQRRGRRSTILTGQQGVLNPAPVRKALLGS